MKIMKVCYKSLPVLVSTPIDSHPMAYRVFPHISVDNHIKHLTLIHVFILLSIYFICFSHVSGG